MGTSNSTLINMDNVINIYRVVDQKSGKWGSKLLYSEERFIIVEEEMQKILQLVQEFKIGEFQTCDWVDTIPNIEEQLNNSYDNFNNSYPQRHTRPRHSYNNRNYTRVPY
jgi:hypothetical protein